MRTAPSPPLGMPMLSAASMETDAVLAAVGSGEEGLSPEEAARRVAEIGPNVLRTHGASAWRVLGNQLRNPLLPLLAVASIVSGLTGAVTDAGIILFMVVASVGLGFYNEFRSEKAVEALHAQIHHRTTVIRGGSRSTTDVTALVPGDIVDLSVGDVVPADLRLLRVDRFECGEAVLTGESMPAEKQVAPVATPESPIALPSCAFMGTVVHAGTGRGVVVQTGGRTEFGKIAMQLGERHAETSFQRGLRDFSKLLVKITAVLVIAIFVINVVIGRPIIDAVLFSLAVAVGITPELLPAIVTISLATGAARMAKKSVLVRRLVAIEDFGNISVLFTDKTGTLTEGQISFTGAADPAGAPSPDVLLMALLCSDVVVERGVPTGGSPLDQALWAAPEAAAAPTSSWRVLDTAPFDYDRRRMSAL
ncbi:MAG: HAD-IC family P-type ATPase, partial [Thermoplasmata archaeon]|nr:HAD-IC family P-type ATPase [Thermoplasmata archaeon]